MSTNGIIRRIEDLLFNRVSWLKTLYFNFYYLPLKQAVKLPIYLHKPHFQREYGGGSLRLKGKVIIDSEVISQGMIRLGFIQSTSHHDHGFLWSNEGVVVFKGNCKIAQGSAIRNGGGTLVIGKNFSGNPNTKFFCYEKIIIGNDVVGSWDVNICDYDFHAMKDSQTGEKRNPYGAILIGDNNWIGQNVVILKNTTTPKYITMAAGSVVSGNYECKERSILMGNPAVVVAEGKRYMDINDCYFDRNKNYNMIIGYTTGVYDMFHIGHLNILRRAKEQCDFLIVGVTTDELCFKRKQKYPIINEKERMAIIEAIRYVDKVVPQTDMDKIRPVKEFGVNVVFVGSDWKGTETWNNYEKEFAKEGCSVVYLSHTDGISSSMLREKING